MLDLYQNNLPVTTGAPWSMSLSEQLDQIYQRLSQTFGPQGWWPADTPFEVAVGAILTQNTNWRNVTLAIERLKTAGLLTPAALETVPEAALAELIRPAGYYRVKARRLKNLAAFLCRNYGGSLDSLAAADHLRIREELLRLKGIGPETADNILLYALQKPVFVVDAYTHRILSRHGLAPETCSYEELQELFHAALPPEVPLFQEYHALLVRLGKTCCRPRPRCQACPLVTLLGPPA